MRKAKTFTKCLLGVLSIAAFGSSAFSQGLPGGNPSPTNWEASANPIKPTFQNTYGGRFYTEVPFLSENKAKINPPQVSMLIDVDFTYGYVLESLWDADTGTTEMVSLSSGDIPWNFEQTLSVYDIFNFSNNYIAHSRLLIIKSIGVSPKKDANSINPFSVQITGN